MREPRRRRPRCVALVRSNGSRSSLHPRFDRRRRVRAEDAGASAEGLGGRWWLPVSRRIVRAGAARVGAHATLLVHGGRRGFAVLEELMTHDTTPTAPLTRSRALVRIDSRTRRRIRVPAERAVAASLAETLRMGFRVGFRRLRERPRRARSAAKTADADAERLSCRRHQGDVRIRRRENTADWL